MHQQLSAVLMPSHLEWFIILSYYYLKKKLFLQYCWFLVDLKRQQSLMAGQWQNMLKMNFEQKYCSGCPTVTDHLVWWQYWLALLQQVTHMFGTKWRLQLTLVQFCIFDSLFFSFKCIGTVDELAYHYCFSYFKQYSWDVNHDNLELLANRQPVKENSEW